jgi:rhamnosyl/mannosyltransferase
MKVLEVNKFYAPFVGGVETVVKQIARGLAERHHVRIATSHHDFHPRTTLERDGNVEVERAGSVGTLMNFALAPRFFEIYRRGVEWSDLIHFHVPSPLPELAGLLFSLPSDVPVVVTFHADPEATRWKKFAPLYKLILRPLLRRADRIVVTAPDNARETKVLAPYLEKCEVIPLGTKYTPRIPDRGKKRELKQNHLEVSPDAPVILFVGRLSYYKGLSYLLEAMRQLSAYLIVVGSGEEREKLEARTSEHDLGNVRFEGYVPDDLLPKYYQSADIFAFPSVTASEAFGIVQLDAMAHGLPVVNTDLATGVPFVSRHGETGITVPPRDSQALICAFNRLLRDEKLRNRLGRQAVERAQSFTVNRMIDRYEDLFECLRE